MKSATGRNMLAPVRKFTTPAAPQLRTVLTLGEVAWLLHVSDTTVYRLIKRDPTFPAYRIGTDWRFNKEDIDAWRLDAAKQGARK